MYLFLAASATSTQLALDLIHDGFCELCAILGNGAWPLLKYLFHYISYACLVHIVQLDLLQRTLD